MSQGNQPPDISDSDFDTIRVGENDRVGQSNAFETVGSVRGTDAVKSIWAPQNRKRLIFYVVVVVLLVSAIIYSFFFMKQTDIKGGVAGDTSAAARVRGSETADQPTSELQREAARDYNQNELAEQQRTNPTAHPMVVTDPDERSVNTDMPYPTKSEQGKADRITKLGNTQASSNPNPGTKVNGTITPEDVNNMDTLLLGMINDKKKGPSVMVNDWNYSKVSSKTKVAQANATHQVDGETGITSSSQCKRIERAGKMAIGTADFAVNSDVGGNISITLRNGKARNAQLIGTFERKETWLRMEFDKLSSDDYPEPIPIKAIGLDMDSSLNAVAGDVDNHTLYRYGWWGVGTALKAVGVAAQSNANQQLAISDGTVIQSTKADSSREIKMAIGSLGNDLGSIMQDRLKRPITVSLKVNDEIGVFFLDDVCVKTVIN